MPRSVKYSLYIIPADMRHLSNVGSMRGRRRRRRPSIEPTLIQRVFFQEMYCSCWKTIDCVIIGVRN